MKTPTESIPARFGVVLVMEFGLFAYGGHRMAVYSTWESQMWADFWLAVMSSILLVAVWPVLWRGRFWLRVAGALLCVLPLYVLYWAVADHFSQASWLP